MAKKNNDPNRKARVHKDLEGFEIKVSPTGEVLSNFTHDQINEFLNKYVKDKKLTQEQKAEQDDRMFPIQESKPEDEDAADEAFFRTTSRKGKGKGKKKADDEPEEPTGADE